MKSTLVASMRSELKKLWNKAQRTRCKDARQVLLRDHRRLYLRYRKHQEWIKTMGF